MLLTTAWLELSCKPHSSMWLSASEMTLFPSPVGSHTTLGGGGGTDINTNKIPAPEATSRLHASQQQGRNLAVHGQG